MALYAMGYVYWLYRGFGLYSLTVNISTVMNFMFC